MKELVALLLRHGTGLDFGNVLLEQIGFPQVALLPADREIVLYCT